MKEGTQTRIPLDHVIVRLPLFLEEHSAELTLIIHPNEKVTVVLILV